MKEKQFFLNIKKQLLPNTFIQKIENKFNSGFPDLIIINEKLPLFIELKAPTKGNTFKIEPSQISTHLRLQANNYVSFFLVQAPSKAIIYLFDGGILCKAFAEQMPCNPPLSHDTEGFLIYGGLDDCLGSANRKLESLVQRK